MSRITDCALIRRPTDAVAAFTFPAGSDMAVVDLDSYVIAPKELFTEAEIDALSKKARVMYPPEIDVEALNKRRADDDERERLRGLGVKFAEDGD